MKYYYNVEENPISLNDWYGSRHWSIRKKQKDTWFKLLKKVIEANEPSDVERYKIELRVNSRHDPSNVITVIKFFEDTLKELGYIIDDSPKYCRGVLIVPDETLKKKSFTLILERLD